MRMTNSNPKEKLNKLIEYTAHESSSERAGNKSKVRWSEAVVSLDSNKKD